MGETLDFSANASIISQNENINFTMSLYKDGAVVSETGHYDKDVIDSGIIFYKGRVTGANSNFRLCI